MDLETRERILEIMFNNAQSMLEVSEDSGDAQMATTARAILVCVAAARNGDLAELSMFMTGFMAMVSEKHGLKDQSHSSQSDSSRPQSNDLFNPSFN
jgi:hypothetical protein